MSNVVALKKVSPVMNDIEEPIPSNIPKSLTAQWAAYSNPSFVIPDDYKNCGWLDTSNPRDGLAYVIQEDESDLVAIVLNNCLRKHLDGTISFRKDRYHLVQEVLAKFKGRAYVEITGNTGITLLVRGEAVQHGRGWGCYSWVEVLTSWQDKYVQLSGHIYEGYSVAEPLEAVEGEEDLLEWFHEYVMSSECNDDAGAEDKIHSIIDLLSDERQRLINVVESKENSSTLLSNENQLAILNTLFDLLGDEDSLIPFSLLDGFTEGE